MTRSARQPKLSSSARASAFAASSFPQTKTSCSPATFAGSTITSQLIVFSALTTLVSGKARWICSTGGPDEAIERRDGSRRPSSLCSGRTELSRSGASR
jgi:hypothetical protein